MQSHNAIIFVPLAVHCLPRGCGEDAAFPISQSDHSNRILIDHHQQTNMLAVWSQLMYSIRSLQDI